MNETQVKYIATLVGMAVAVITTVFTLDARYVHADELQQFKTEHAQAIQQVSRDSQLQVITLRKQMIEDKVFEITLIKPEKRTDIDRARLDKYQRDLDEIHRTLGK